MKQNLVKVRIVAEQRRLPAAQIWNHLFVLMSYSNKNSAEGSVTPARVKPD